MRTDLQTYLMNCGYHEEDALEITLAYIGGGIEGIKKAFKKNIFPSFLAGEDDNYLYEMVGEVEQFLKNIGVTDATKDN